MQPRNVAAQTEGSIVWALGHVLREKITIKDGRVQQSNFTDYEVMRMSDVPNIEVKVVSTDNKPTGAGEDGAPLVAGAVGNAIAALTGVRLRELPFSPDRVQRRARRLKHLLAARRGFQKQFVHLFEVVHACLSGSRFALRHRTNRGRSIVTSLDSRLARLFSIKRHMTVAWR